MSSQPLMEQDSAWKEHDGCFGEDDSRHLKRCCSFKNQSASSQVVNQSALTTILLLSTQVLLSTLLIANLLTVALISRGQATRGEELNMEPNSAAVTFNFTPRVLHIQYGSDVSYMSLDPQYDWLWSTENDKYAGLIALDPPNEDGSIRWGAITMLHQLHCLTALRTALQRAQRGEAIGLDYRDDAHWPHCLHYLRQGIICHADDTIELPYAWNSTIEEDGTVTTKREGPIDGSQDVRVCRDADELYRLRAEVGYREGQDEW